MTDQERKDRLQALVLAESAEPLRWWWLSFADGDLPKGKQFLGVVIVEARGMIGAIQRSHALKINPGGEVQAALWQHHEAPPATHRDRCLTRREAESLLREARS